MSIADLHDLELVWPSLGPTDVVVTGTFDQWSSSTHLVRSDAGFIATVKVPWGQKIAYKFIVDGQWRCREDRPREDDGNGNINNVLQTPEKPATPARLSIPPNGAPTQGSGDVDNMVTAVEFLPSAEPVAVRGLLLLPIPQITVEGIGQVVPTPVNESRLNTAAATEGNVSPASVIASQNVSILPLSGDGSLSSPSMDGNEEIPDGLATHAPIQFSRLGPAVPETAGDVATAPSETTVPQPPQIAQVGVPTVDQEPVLKVVIETAAPVLHQQSAILDSRASTSSIPSSGTLTQKKRRSLFSRIKHMFDKHKDKGERKPPH